MKKSHRFHTLGLVTMHWPHWSLVLHPFSIVFQNTKHQEPTKHHSSSGILLAGSKGRRDEGEKAKRRNRSPGSETNTELSSRSC